MNNFSILFVLLIIFTACSKDNDLINKPIASLSYKCSSGKVGKTDFNGKYECEDGDSVTFSIGLTEVAIVDNTDNGIITSKTLFANKLEASTFISDIQSLDGDVSKQNITITTALENKINIASNTTEESTKDTSQKKESEIKEKISTKKANIGTTVEDAYPSYQYRAFGMGGDSGNSQARVELDDKVYTILAFSQKNIAQLDASTAGDVTTIIVSIEKNSIFKQLQITISQDYLDSDIVIKIYNSINLFDYKTLKGFSTKKHLANSGTYIDFGIINIQ